MVRNYWERHAPYWKQPRTETICGGIGTFEEVDSVPDAPGKILVDVNTSWTKAWVAEQIAQSETMGEGLLSHGSIIFDTSTADYSFILSSAAFGFGGWVETFQMVASYDPATTDPTQTPSKKPGGFGWSHLAQQVKGNTSKFYEQ